jgi:hypothetical protein
VSTRRRTRSTNQAGQTSLMILGFTIVLVMMVVAVVDASAIYLHKSGLNTVADGAALAGADALDETDTLAHGGGSPKLSQAMVDQAVKEYVASVGAGRDYPGLHVKGRVVGDEVHVSTSATKKLPIPLPGIPRLQHVSTSASAEFVTLAG